jgi:hypothetical protein
MSDSAVKSSGKATKGKGGNRKRKGATLEKGAGQEEENGDNLLSGRTLENERSNADVGDPQPRA